jgi:hypothetical protein
MNERKMPTMLVVLLLLCTVGLILLFASLIGPPAPSPSGHTLKDALGDKVIDEDEFQELSGMSCEEIKALLGTDRNVCIYLKDLDGNMIVAGDHIASFGCPGLFVEGSKVCG